MTQVLGVDVGGTSIAIGWGPDWSVHVEAPTTTTSPAAFVDQLVGLIGGAVATIGRVDGIGIGIPGLVQPEQGTVSGAVNLGIDNDPLPLAAMVQEAVGVPVAIDNDVRAAALGSWGHLLGHDDRPGDLVHLNIGTGVSAGSVIRGQPLRGVGGIAGELGHAPLGEPDHACACGMTGCLEATVGGAALQARTSVPARDLLASLVDQPSDQVLDEELGEAVQSAIDAVARTLLVVCMMVDPTVVVLDGGVGRTIAASARRALAAHVADGVFADAVDPSRVVVLDGDVHPGIRGAGLLGGRAATYA